MADLEEVFVMWSNFPVSLNFWPENELEDRNQQGGRSFGGKKMDFVNFLKISK